ncbi:MAG: hypothetical protein M1816_006698 [Peltula sp. TS41687]|nr:MAG: hypothetical protein M1816_006698 [Peltula sp. TS41687]
MSFAATAFLFLASLATAQRSYLPTVDLGYTIQQASSYNGTAKFYSFSNIRYAAPPVGELRFAAPVPAAENRTVQTGTVNRICHQVLPAWFLISQQFVPAYLSGNLSAFNTSAPASPSSSSTNVNAIPTDPRETEDCLFLDVVVPEGIFRKRGLTSGAPVLVWIHGGAYTVGNKASDGSPAGLIARSENGPAQGIIYVAINYRLGAFGWLGGSTLQQANGTANAGLLDQRLALEWVQSHIHAFGGDPKRVTVFGESAGGGSILHQLTAYGGSAPVPFQQVIPQSPGWLPVPGNDQQEQVLQRFLDTLGVKTIQEARTLPEKNLTDANTLLVGLAPYGQTGVGPVVDGTFVPDLPGKLLLEGKFAKDVKVMVGHNANEGLVFASPYVRTQDDYVSLIRTDLPTASPEVVDYISQTLYPPIFNGSFGYRDQIQRTALTLAEVGFSCNTNYLGRAYGNQTYNYLFSIPPALHGQDVPYTFFDGPNPMVLATPIAIALQEYITSFAATGNPNEDGVPRFDFYGDANEVQNLNVTGIEEIKDPAANERCAWWQLGLYA